MGHRVLVVEDEPHIVESLSFLMKQAGFEVAVARDGAAAIRVIESRPPDLVLLDLMLPRRDGFDVCREVRANPDWRGIRIVILSAKGREQERRKGLELGADDYIIKPFSTHDVVERVRALLNGSRS